MSQYLAGNATVTNGSPTVTGTNTLWLANVTAGDSFTIASTGVMYDVASVDSDTQVTLSVAYAGVTASGAVYTIARDFTSPDDFPEMSQGDIETATIFTRAIRKIQGKISALVSDISGKANQATTYTETEVDSLLDDKADISGQVFTGDIAAPKITASTGILFGTDTAAANTLDDYEEGTWTPTMAGLTLTTAEGSYIKVGSLVTANFRINSTSKTSTSLAAIGGLPFNRDAAVLNRTAGFLNFSENTAPAYLLFSSAGSTVNFREMAGAAELSITQVSGNQNFATLVYRAA